MKYIVQVVAAAIVGAVLCGCGHKDAEADHARNFVVGFSIGFPPYGYKSGTEYKGFDLDLARAVCSRKGWNFVANPIGWDTKDASLDSGIIDCIWNGFTIEGREDAYTFSIPYIDNSQVVLVKALSKIATLADLTGKCVGVLADTSVHKALSTGGALEALGDTFKELVVKPDYNQLMRALKMGVIDAVAFDVGIARKKMADQPDTFRILDEILMKETYGVGFKKGNTALCDEVNDALRELAAEGIPRKLAEKYDIDQDSVILR